MAASMMVLGMEARFAFESARVRRGLYFGSAPHTREREMLAIAMASKRKRKGTGGTVEGHTLSSTADLFAHHLTLLALCLVIPGLVMFNSGPFVVTGQEPGRCPKTTIRIADSSPTRWSQNPAELKRHDWCYINQLAVAMN